MSGVVDFRLGEVSVCRLSGVVLVGCTGLIPCLPGLPFGLLRAAPALYLYFEPRRALCVPPGWFASWVRLCGGCFMVQMASSSPVSPQLREWGRRFARDVRGGVALHQRPTSVSPPSGPVEPLGGDFFTGAASVLLRQEAERRRLTDPRWPSEPRDSRRRSGL